MQVFAVDQATSAMPVSGFYRVSGVTELASQQIKLSVQFHLFNSSADSVTLTSLVFHPERSFSTAQTNAALNSQSIATSLDLPSKSPVNLTSEIVISSDEYRIFQHERRLRLQATMQFADGTTQTRTLALQADLFQGVK
jgi:hypothetical protein